MYKKLIVLIFNGLLSIVLHGQVNVEWSFKIGESVHHNTIEKYEFGKAITTDNNDNIYVMGTFFDIVDFDPGAGVNNIVGYNNIDSYYSYFVSKYDKDGNYKWAFPIHARRDESFDMFTTPTGNTYVTGDTWGKSDLDPGPGVVNLEGPNFFLSKYDTDGNYIWSINVEDSLGDCKSESISANLNEEIYVVGGFSQEEIDLSLGTGSSIQSMGDHSDIFIAKYDVNSNHIWSFSIGSDGIDRATSVVTDTNNNIYVVGKNGNFGGDNDTADFDPGAAVSLVAGGGFVAKYDGNGDYKWAFNLNAIITSITVGRDDYIYITGKIGSNLTGQLADTVDFDPGPALANLILTGATNVFVAKYDKDGNYIWAFIEGNGLDDSNKIITDLDGNIYITGRMQGEIFVSKYDENGDNMWTLYTGGITNDYSNSIAINNDNDLYITGMIDKTLTSFFPTIEMGISDIFISKLSQTGGVTGTVYNDLNLNCIKENDEIGIFGVDVTINPGNYSIKTNSLGVWRIDTLPVGSYTATYDTLNRWTTECINPQSFTVVNSDSVLAVPGVGLKAKFGFANGLIYHDINENCLKDTNEIGLANREGIINPGNILVETDSSGYFVSDTLDIGSYTLTLDTTGRWQESCLVTIPFNVYSYGLDTVREFGLKAKFGFANGLIYHDVNENCVKEINEIGLANRKGIITPGNILVETDSSGYFVSDTLDIGSYTLTLDTTGRWQESCLVTIPFNVYSYGLDTIREFGLKAKFGFAKGLIFNDVNAGCVRDSNEIGLANKTGVIMPGSIIVQTDSLGYWESDTLDVGNYALTLDTNSRWEESCLITIPFEVFPYGSLDTIFDFGLKAKFGFANGLVYHDINENCIKEVNEVGKPSITGIINPGNVVVQTDSLGFWEINDSLSLGNYILTVDTITNWRVSCVGNTNFQVLPFGVADTMSWVGLKSIAPCPAPAISVNMSNLFRCFDNQKINIQACNTNYGSDSIINAYVELQLDTLLTPSTTTSSDVSFTAIGNNTYHVDIGTLNPGECVDFWLAVDVSCDAVLGQTLCMQANLYPVDSCVLDTVPAIQTGEVSLCSSPWDNSSLTVDGWCQNDSIYFTVTNMGDFGSGDMQCYSPVRIFIDGVYTILDSVLLTGGQTQQFIFSGDGRTWRMEADQHPLHPGHSYPNATVERCGDSTNWTPNLVNILPMNDADPIVDIYCGVVTGSYDPNDKTGYPLGVGTDHIVAPNGKLDYVIRFQNTGTAPAVTVVIRDTLDVDLDIFSVQSGVSSHDYTFTMYGPRVLEWTFNNIMLPDSISDPEGSKGFVTFTVNQIPDLSIGTEINNSVGIYFDFNEPVITNTTSHIIGVFDNLPVGIKKEIIANEVLTIYPNPTGKTLNVILVDNKPVQFHIYSIDGKLVESMTIRGNTSLDVSTYNSGMYFIKAINSDGKIFQSKFVKE